MPNEEKQPTLSDVIKPIKEKAAAAPAASTDETTIPDAYQGKSLDDVIALAQQHEKNHAEAQKVIGRQGNELGEVRRLADSLIQADIDKRATGTQTSDDNTFDLDSFDDPKAATTAISKLVEAKVEERLRGVSGDLNELRGLSVEQRLNSDHPEWRSVITSEEYTKWVQASPVRTRLAQEGNSGNYASGHELLSLWEALNPKKAESDDAGLEDSSKDDVVKAATLETGGSKRSTRGKPNYLYKDIMQLRMKDPEKYDSMRAEIRKAFAEGRVK